MELNEIVTAQPAAAGSWLDRIAQGSWGVLSTQVGLGVILGLAVGYTAKKALRLALLLLGVTVIAGVYLTRSGFITVHWESVEAAYEQYVNGRGGLGLLIKEWAGFLSGYIPVSGSFLVGFVLGFRAG